jgi:hypothetical protein
VGLVIHERFRVALEGVPPFQLMAHVGLDLVHVDHGLPGHFGTLTLWLGGGYERLVFIPNNTPDLYAGFASVRATYELKWGMLILRPEVFARLQTVIRYDQDNSGEGNYDTFPSTLPTLQLGAKLGVGITARR